MHVLLNKKTVRAVEFLLLFTLVMMVLFMARNVISSLSAGAKHNSPTEAPNEPPPGTDERPVSEKHGLADYSVAVSDNPFGIKGQAFAPLSAVSGTEKAGGSMGKIKLLGTIAGNKGTGYAVLESEDGKQEIFKTGDSVFSGGTLKTIAPKYVVVSGVKIDLADIQTASQGTTPETPSGGAFIRPTATNSYVVDGNKIRDAIDNPKQLMTDARLQPRYVDGKQEGFFMQEVRQGGLYDQLGLRNGDVLLSVNKYDITNPETGLQAFTALRGASDIRLDILRAGTKVTMNYQIR